MNTHDIIKMAREASGDDWGIFKHFMPEIERFAALVAATEREACAKVCDSECNPTPYEGHITMYQSGGYIMAEYLSAAIRSRGQDV